MSKPTKPLWQTPWGYAESFVIAFGLLLIGFLLEFTIQSNSGVSIKYPMNLILGAIFITFILVFYRLIRKSNLYHFLSGVPASVGAIAVLTLLVIIMGITPQVSMQEENLITRLSLNQLTTSWPFLFINLYLLVVLALVIVRKSFPFRLKNWGFVCSHLGLWITIFAAGLGSGDLMRLKMDLYTNKTEWKAYDNNGNYYELPLAIKLNDFLIEEFNPKLAVVENESGKLYEATKPSMIMIEDELECTLHDWNIKIDDFLVSSGRVGEKYHQMYDFGAAPAAKVSVAVNSSDTLSGWISCGSFNRPHESLKLDDNYSLLMTVPEPKKFSSKVTIFTPDGQKEEQVLEVNKPQSVNGWKIYQLSYDEKMGKYSNLSVVEVVKDPWQVYVYIGIFMMMIGAIYMFWRGNKVTISSEQ
ncbi:cytochrome c biogenesis protein ResB [Marinifilum sp. D714]|uniref:cytochrome c biogenesis protein ResB n=1 Tax=Marinifilum sp. D714 TaxID=2937523 RepID=UPI0027CAFD0C|nr:cytochrome c biogenesis protein ResB [Marinifilum sp. D714]MDQ2177579.1 cytochrome c biogenesis protein ResB [Marinifilum sp. D714]